MYSIKCTAFFLSLTDRTARNRPGRWLFLIFVLLAPAGFAEHHTADTHVHPAIDIPFELIDRNIRVEATIEDRPGYFLVDTGASQMVLNSARLPDWEPRTTDLARPVHGAGGKVAVSRQIRTGEFRLQSIKVPTMQAMYQDLSVLEGKLKTPILGLIGADFLSQFVVEFDYTTERLRLYSHAGAPDKKEALAVVDYQRVHHLPVVDIRVGDWTLKMGVDSGAAAGVLATSWFDGLSESLSALQQTEMTGIDGRDQQVSMARLAEFRLQNLPFTDQPFLFADLKLGHEIKVDGLLGYDFLSRYRTLIDFRNQTMAFYQASSKR